MKTHLTTSEKILTLSGIAAVGAYVSTLIGKQLVSQCLWTALILYLFGGGRPGIIYAFFARFKRDMM